MAGLSRKEIVRLVEHIEPQGVRITRTKDGLLLRLPDMSTAMVHFTTSDVRAEHNLRAKLRRAGISYPTDRHPMTDLPSYITEKRNSPERLQKAREALMTFDSVVRVHPRTLMLALGLSKDYTTTYSLLYALGYRPEPGKEGKRGRLWLLDAAEDDARWAHEFTAPALAAEAETAVEPEPAPVATIVTLGGGSDIVQPQGLAADAKPIERVAALFRANPGRTMTRLEVTASLGIASPQEASRLLYRVKATGLIEHTGDGHRLVEPSAFKTPPPSRVVQDAVEETSTWQPDAEPLDAPGAPEPPAPPIPTEPGEVAAREFLDSVDSWTVDLDDLPPETTLAELRRFYQASHLAVELRIWRAGGHA